MGVGGLRQKGKGRAGLGVQGVEIQLLLDHRGGSDRWDGS